MKYFTDADVRRELLAALGNSTQAAFARKIGVMPNFLSMIIGGAPITGKVLAYLGYRKVQTRLYEKAKNG